MTLLTRPQTYDPVKNPARCSTVVRTLLCTHPNQPISHEAVVDMLGYRVTPQATSLAVRRLRDGAWGLTIERTRGGYVLLVPVPATGTDRCGGCLSRDRAGRCGRLKGLPVEKDEVCFGYEGEL